MSPHLDVARALMPIITSPDHRARLRSQGYGPESAIVACAETDFVADVSQRVTVGVPPTLLAFFMRGELRIMFVRPDGAGDGRGERGTPYQPVDRRTTIGMLYDAATGTGETRFRISPWAREQVASIPRSDVVEDQLFA